MRAKQSSDLSDAVARAKRPLQSPAMPRASLGIRLRTVPALHRLVPRRVIVARARKRALKRWNRYPYDRACARAAIDAIVGATKRADEVEALALAHVIEDEITRAPFWRPLPLPSVEPSSSQHLREALACGRGVLVSSCHIGPFYERSALIGAAGRRSFAIAAPWLFEQPSDDYWGRRLVRYWHFVERGKVQTILATGSFPVIHELLSEGEVVTMMFDMPGSRETRFLGKPVMFSSGSAKLAFATEALVLPMRARRDGHRIWDDFAPPLDSREFASWEQLHDTLAAVHERWVLEHPAAMEDPRRPGAWEQSATASGWGQAPTAASG